MQVSGGSSLLVGVPAVALEVVELVCVVVASRSPAPASTGADAVPAVEDALVEAAGAGVGSAGPGPLGLPAPQAESRRNRARQDVRIASHVRPKRPEAQVGCFGQVRAACAG
jgi:hypothetical protein